MDRTLESRFDQLLRRHAELGAALSGAGLSGAEFARLSKEYSELSPIIDGIENLRRTTAEVEAAAEMAQAGDDPDMKALAEEEVRALKERLPELELTVKMSLLPRDTDDERNAILEIRAGTGGDEAALFAARLFRMYQRYAALRGWRFELLDLSETGLGGFKEAVASITGRDVFARRNYESGVHPRPRAADRKSQVGSGDRSERIRTYNFPQGRVTDHRIGLTLYKIDKIMSGEALDEIIDALTTADRAAKLAMADA